jgi:hypothetical protein
MASKVTTVDNGNMISNSGRKRKKGQKGEENYHLKEKVREKNARGRHVSINVQYSRLSAVSSRV